MTEYAVPILLLFIPLFIFAIFIAFFIPGRLVLRELQLSAFQSSVLSITLGIVLWGWAGFIFGFLGIRWASYLYLITGIILWLRTDDKNRILTFIKLKQFRKGKYDVLLLLILTLGTVFQLASIYLTGIQTGNGISFCCVIPDTLYHIALTNQLVASVPPMEPGASGLVVHNYHYLGNLISADLIRVFHLPLIATQYQYLTVLLSLLIGLTGVTLGEILHLKKSFSRWLVFFLYFSGDLTIFLPVFFGKGIDFNVPLLESAVALWASPPRVFGLVVFMGALSILILWSKRPSTRTGIALALMLSSLIGFKIYFGVFMAIGVTALAIYYLFTKKFQMLFPLILTGILSALLYFPVNPGAGGLVFIGHPWVFENFIAAQPIPFFQHIESGRLIYLAKHNMFGVIRFEIVYAIVYFIFAFGTVTLGVFQSKRSLAQFPKELNIFLIPGFIICIILGSFFFQTIGGGNSVQFLITVDIFASLYAALTYSYWLNRLPNVIRVGAIIFIVIITVPRVVHDGSLNAYVTSINPPIIVDNNQLQAIAYIKTQTPAGSTILVDNLPLPKAMLPTETRTWVGDNAYYISFLANRPLFLDGVIAQSHGATTQGRIAIEDEILKNKNVTKTKQLLHANHIAYLFLSSTSFLANKPPSFLQVVLKNSTVTLLRVNSNS